MLAPWRPAHTLTLSFPPVRLARWTASSSYSVYEGPGIQGAAGADLFGSPVLLPFQLLLSPGLCPGQVAGGGEAASTDPRSGFVLSSGPVPQMSWGEENRALAPFLVAEGVSGQSGNGLGPGLSHSDQPSLGQPWCPVLAAHLERSCSRLLVPHSCSSCWGWGNRALDSLVTLSIRF